MYISLGGVNETQASDSVRIIFLGENYCVAGIAGRLSDSANIITLLEEDFGTENLRNDSLKQYISEGVCLDDIKF